MGNEIEFANRTYELDVIRRPGGTKFIVVDAPAGYGKSFLLRKAEETYMTRQGWLVILVDLKSGPDISNGRATVARAAIANEIAKQVGAEKVADSSMDEGAVTYAVNELLQPRAQKLLILFDGIEVLSMSVSRWLQDMISGLEGTLRIAGKELRVVLAGRYAKDWCSRATFGLRRLELSPFDLEIVRSIVESVLKRGRLTDQNIGPDFVDAMATYIQWISGGHPKGICGIVSEIQGLEAVPTPLEHFFVRREFHVNGKSGTLFDLYVEPIVHEITDPLPEEIKRVLEIISVFRKFNPDVLDILANNEEIEGFDSGWVILEQLTKTRLVDTPNLANPMYSDEIVRRMLAVRLCINDRVRYERLNRQARDVFRTWAGGDKMAGLPAGELDTQFRLVSIVESLYHAVSLMQHTIDPTDPRRIGVGQKNENAIVKEIEQYRDKIKTPDAAVRLKAALTGDQELQELICSRAGERGYSRLLSTVKGFIPDKQDEQESQTSGKV